MLRSKHADVDIVFIGQTEKSIPLGDRIRHERHNRDMCVGECGQRFGRWMVADEKSLDAIAFGLTDVGCRKFRLRANELQVPIVSLRKVAVNAPQPLSAGCVHHFHGHHHAPRAVDCQPVETL